MGGEFIAVKNFERFQHYKDRKPTWIKLYNDLLDDYDFCALPDASKWLAIGLWLLASRSDNRIRNDPVWIGRMVHSTEPVDLTVLLTTGFVYYLEPASKLLAEPEQDASLEEEAIGEANEEAKEIIFLVRTRDEEIDGVIRAANRGMKENPKIANPEPISISHASRQDVFEWLNQGVPAALAESVVFERCKAYPPGPSRKQPHTMRYFTGAVLDAYDKHKTENNGSSGLPRVGRPEPQAGGAQKRAGRFSIYVEDGDTPGGEKAAV